MSVVPKSPLWVDFHCHLDLYPDHQELIRQCDAEKILTLGVTTTPKAFKRNVEMALGYRHIVVGLGLHPQLISTRAGELALFEKLLSTTRYVGEIGLDAGPRHYASFPEQRRVFGRILAACDEQGGKIMSIHSVRTVAKVLADLETHMRKRACVSVLHWFTGTRSQMARAVDLGCYFSVNVEMVGNKKMRPLLAAIPIDRLLTETDGPFVKFGERTVRPTDIPATIGLLAHLRGTDASTLAQQVTANFVAMCVAAREGRGGDPMQLPLGS